MCGATLITQEMTMATTQLMRAAFCEVCWPVHDEQKTEFRIPRMNWVVVTDENGNRRLQIDWRADRDDGAPIRIIEERK